MKIVYHAENGMDASLVKDLLSSAGIHAEVRGTALQGAVGEAPAMNNVKVWVGLEDYAEAREIVTGWESAEIIIDDENMFDEEDDYPQEPMRRESHLVREVLIAVVIVLLFVAATIEF
ncbi:DUF2007 domain-containing protein [Kangiella sp.]|uniref:putative signal transducing protein n=1 Tax=Kangiella sp. TaxID=1920245 RepID=UPI00199AA724|nr:DUF2007 domain-containing protein [Kangiella sp.]MBD3654340.1 DUF2007 domain-containing protein [Kangiella sp.]